MMLKIKNIGPKDFGSYKCVAQNSLGITDGDIKLDGKFHFDIVRIPAADVLCTNGNWGAQRS